MRGIFGLVALLMALAAVGLLVRQQMHTAQTALPALQPFTRDGEAAQGGIPPVTSPASGAALPTSKQIEQQVKQAVEQAMQPRPQPADTP